LLAEDPVLANQTIQWGEAGKNSAHPLHYISDMLFDGTLAHGKGIALMDVLVKAGADCNHQASNGETPLIGAASLAAEDVGLRLLESGAQPGLTGAFQETALHWAAHLGLRALVARLIEKGADVNQKDGRFHSSPLGWAIHGRFHASPGSQGNHHEVAALLVAGGARVESEWLADERVGADAEILSALRGDCPKARVVSDEALPNSRKTAKGRVFR
jgi:hypothetical protein